MAKSEVLRELAPSAPGRGRPRSPVCHATILDAVLGLLESEGYDGITIEGVARQAKVGKQTIYRRWNSKPELILEAYAKHVETQVPIPDRGTLRADLEAFLTTAFSRLSKNSGPIMRGLMGDAARDGDFASLLRDVFIVKRRQSIRRIFESAQARGELRPDADFELMMDLIFGPVWYRLLNRHGKLDRAYARKLVDALLLGFAAGR